MDKISFIEWLGRWSQDYSYRPAGQRQGQHAVNHLYNYRPDLVDNITGTDKDPFYSNKNWDNFMTYLALNW